MRIASLAGRATLVVPGSDDQGVDVAKASDGRFGPDLHGPYEDWDAFRAFVTDLDLGTPGGVGVSRKPPRLLQPSETLTSWIEGIGTIRTSFIAPAGGHVAG
jgi:hypothetical protein